MELSEFVALLVLLDPSACKLWVPTPLPMFPIFIPCTPGNNRGVPMSSTTAPAAASRLQPRPPSVAVARNSGRSWPLSLNARPSSSLQPSSPWPSLPAGGSGSPVALPLGPGPLHSGRPCPLGAYGVHLNSQPAVDLVVRVMPGQAATAGLRPRQGLIEDLNPGSRARPRLHTPPPPPPPFQTGRSRASVRVRLPQTGGGGQSLRNFALKAREEAGTMSPPATARHPQPRQPSAAVACNRSRSLPLSLAARPGPRPRSLLSLLALLLLFLVAAAPASAQQPGLTITVDEVISNQDEVLSNQPDDQPIFDCDDDEVCLYEGGSVLYGVRLNSPPAVNVVVRVMPGQAGSNTLTAEFETLTFTPADWQTPQQVRISVSDNDYASDNVFLTSAAANHISIQFVASGGVYDDVSAQAVVLAIEDDMIGLILSENMLSLGEGGGPGEYGLRLSSQPISDVMVRVEPAPSHFDVRVNSGETAVLTFAPDNWDQIQLVTVSVLNDDRAPPESEKRVTINHVVESAGDSTYNNLPAQAAPPVTLSITDGDRAKVLLSGGSNVARVEGGPPVRVGVRLQSEPLGEVQVVVSVLNQGAFTIIVEPAEGLVFTPTNWRTEQQVTITVVDDDVDDVVASGTIGRLAPFIYDPLGGGYDTHLHPGETGESSQIDILDNDDSGLSISETSLTLAEGGDAQEYEVRLTSRPIAPVTLKIEPGATSFTVEVGGPEVTSVLVRGGLIPALVFGTEGDDWRTPKTVRVRVLDDQLALAAPDEVVEVTLIHTVMSEDAQYSPENLEAPDILLSITDNDGARRSPVADLAVSAGGRKPGGVRPGSGYAARRVGDGERGAGALELRCQGQFAGERRSDLRAC